MKRGNKNNMVFGVICLFTFVMFAADGVAKDPEYPTRPIEFIITWAAGGATDLSCRALCDLASKYLPKPLIPVNKPGAAGVIGSTLIKEAKPDGYTIGSFTMSPVLIAPFVQEVSYDSLKDFTPIVHYGEYVGTVMVRGDKPWKTWKELIEWVRKHPGETKVGLAGPRHTQVQGIALTRVALKENVKFTFVPFKGSLEVLAALIGGNIDVFASNMDASTWDYINTGKIRIISFLSKRKLPGHEGIPSTEEMYGIGIGSLMGVAGPKGLPPYVTKTLEEVLTKAIKDPSFADLMKKMFTPIAYMTGDEMGRYVEKAYKEHQEIIKQMKEEEAGKK